MIFPIDDLAKRPCPVHKCIVSGALRISLPLQSDTQSVKPADHRQSAIEALAAENRELRARVEYLEARLAELA